MIIERVRGRVPVGSVAPSTTNLRLDEVCEVVFAIESGHVMSYGDIGVLVGLGPRQVGRAMALIAAQGMPWWRVVYSDGTPARCHDGQAPLLLAQERTPMRGTRVDMSRARQTIVG
ncbi:MGMT family protein [Williamsia sp. 1138]|uniref:MGMT family protein n=1 Tax=Williamsia sp. 1138 TaxID=1903117 RepID=UPI001FEFA6FD|nr:MGMT family protein [Williamsia sp. 1138]